jgi:hypothetical protein
MSRHAAGFIRSLPLLLLLMVCGGLGMLLYYQRKEIARTEHAKKVGQFATSPNVNQAPKDAISNLSAEEILEMNELTPLDRLDEHLQQHFQDAQASHGKFQQAFARSGRSPGLTKLNPRATTHVEFETQYLNYLRRDAEVYLAHTQDPEPIRAAGAEFIRATCTYDSARDFGPEAATLARTADELLKQSNDPLLRASVLFEIEPGNSTRDFSKRIEQEIEESISKLAGTTYPAIAEVMLRCVVRRRGDAAAQGIGSPRRLRLNQAIVKWMKEETPEKEFHRCVYRRMREMVESSDLPQLLVLLSREPEMEPYWIHLLAGETYLDNARAARGGDYANKVKDEQWEKYYSEGDKAMVHLRHAWHLRPEYPVAAGQMISVTLGIDDEGRTRADWFRKAIDAQLDYNLAYDTYLVSLLPRWGGSEQAMIAFGKDCVATDRFDTVVPYVFFDVIEMLVRAEKHPRSTLFQTFPDLKPALDGFCLQRAAWMKEVAALQTPYVHNRFPDLVLQTYLDNRCDQEARELALAIPDDRMPHRISDGAEVGTFSISRLKASNEATGPLIDQLVKRLQRRPVEEYSEENAAADQADLTRLKEVATEPAAMECLGHLAAMVNQRQALARGEWADLLNGPNSFGWEFSAGSAVYDESGKFWQLSGRPDSTHPVGGRPLLPMPVPLEIEAQIGILDRRWNISSESMKGIYWTALRTEAESSIEPALPQFGLLSRDDRGIQAVFTQSSIVGTTFGALLPKRQLQTLRLKLWNESFEFQIDDTIDIGRHQGTLDPEGQLAFGELAEAIGKTDRPMRLGRIRVRRLEMESPQERTAPRAQRLAYWQSRWDTDSNDVTALRELARIVVWTDPARALELARQVQAARPKMNNVRGVVALSLLRLGRDEEADAEVTAADNECGNLVESKVAVIERRLKYPNPTPDQIQAAFNFAAGLEHDGEVMLSKAMMARLMFAGGHWQEAVDWNAGAIELAEEADRPELEARQQEYLAKLKEQQP